MARGKKHAPEQVVNLLRQIEVAVANGKAMGYHDDRTHLALAKHTPAGRKAETNPNADCRVVSMPRLGGLHHRYDLAA
jgi:hypothetical protein